LKKTSDVKWGVLAFLIFLICYASTAYADSGITLPSVTTVSIDGTVDVTGTVGVTGDVDVVQDTADDLKTDANLQVGDADVGPANRIPVTADGTVNAVQSGTWFTQAVQSGIWNIGTVTTLTGITNVVSVDDNGSTLSVDGTVAATQSGSWDIGTLTGITNVVSVDDNAG